MYAASANRPKPEVRRLRDRRYRLGMTDMSLLEIMPKGVLVGLVRPAGVG
jgi:hypothetical protein